MSIGEMGENKHEGLHISPNTPLESADEAPTASAPQRMLLRTLHAWARLRRGMTLGVRAVVINAEGEILLLRHTYAPGWQLPGGGVEVGETAEYALARELVEEAAITPIGPPRLHGLFLNLHLARRDHVAVYVVEHFDAGHAVVPNREITELGFFKPDALPARTTPATRRRIIEVLHGAAPAAHW